MPTKKTNRSSFAQQAGRAKRVSQSLSVSCWNCGKRWLAIFKSGVVKQVVPCPECRESVPTSGVIQLSKLPHCPGCKRKEFLAITGRGRSCQWCGWTPKTSFKL